MDDPFPDGLYENIKSFFAKVDPWLRRGNDLYLEVFDTNLFFPLQRPKELASMIRAARMIKPKVVMEIGADKGGGLYHWCKCLPSVKRVIACEVRGTPYAELFEAAFPDIQFLWIPGSSYDPANVRLVEHFLAGNQLDCLFIDGDKGAFEKDFISYLPLMSRKGIVFMHDIQDQTPCDGYLACIVDRRHGEIINISDSEEAMSREARGLPSANPHESWLRHWKGKSCGVGVIYLGKKPGDAICVP